jgi:hypothetical protein
MAHRQSCNAGGLLFFSDHNPVSTSVYTWMKVCSPI